IPPPGDRRPEQGWNRTQRVTEEVARNAKEIPDTFWPPSIDPRQRESVVKTPAAVVLLGRSCRMNMVVNGEIRNVKSRCVGQQQSLVKVGVFASEQIRPRSTKAGIEASDPLQYRGANDRISTQHRSEAIILPILADAITRINPADDCRVVAGQPFRNRTAP